MFEYEHLCILICAQNQWKEKDYEKISEETLSNVNGGSEHSDCDVCMTCPVCRANWALFDPENPGEYVPKCGYCDVLLPFLKENESGDNLLLFSHSVLKLDVLKQFAEKILDDKKIKKVFVLQLHEWDKKSPKAKELVGLIAKQELKISEFILLLEEEKFEYRVLYEILKDKYY